MSKSLQDVRGSGLPRAARAVASAASSVDGLALPALSHPLIPAGPVTRTEGTEDRPAGVNFTYTPEEVALKQLVALDLFMEAYPQHHWIVSRDGGPWCPDCAAAWNESPESPCDHQDRYLCVRCRQRPASVLDFCGSCALEEQGEGRL